MDVASKLNAFWCAITHAGGRIERDSEGRINWRCATCGRWSDYPVPIDEERRSTDAAIAHYITTAAVDGSPAPDAGGKEGV